MHYSNGRGEGSHLTWAAGPPPQTGSHARPALGALHVLAPRSSWWVQVSDNTLPVLPSQPAVEEAGELHTNLQEQPYH